MTITLIKNRSMVKLLHGDAFDVVDCNMMALHDVIVYDPPWDMDKAYSLIPPPQSDQQTALIMYSSRGFADAVMGAVTAGWRPRVELIWDCKTSLFMNGLPLDRHKAIGVFGKGLFDIHRSTIRDGKYRGQSRIVFSGRGGKELEYTPLDGEKRLSTVEGFNIASMHKTHKHEKPVEWIQSILRSIGAKNVLDMFAGSGGIAEAAVIAGASYTGVEIDRDAYDRAVDRVTAFCSSYMEERYVNGDNE